MSPQGEVEMICRRDWALGEGCWLTTTVHDIARFIKRFGRTFPREARDLERLACWMRGLPAGRPERRSGARARQAKRRRANRGREYRNPAY